MKTLFPLLSLLLTLSATQAFASPSDLNGVLHSTGGVGLTMPVGSSNSVGVLITGNSALQLYGLFIGKLAGPMELANNLTCWKPDSASAQCTLEIDPKNTFSLFVFYTRSYHCDSTKTNINSLKCSAKGIKIKAPSHLLFGGFQPKPYHN